MKKTKLMVLRNMKRWLAGMLAVAMILTAIPGTSIEAFAAEETEEETSNVVLGDFSDEEAKDEIVEEETDQKSEEAVRDEETSDESINKEITDIEDDVDGGEDGSKDGASDDNEEDGIGKAEEATDAETGDSSEEAADGIEENVENPTEDDTESSVEEQGETKDETAVESGESQDVVEEAADTTNVQLYTVTLNANGGTFGTTDTATWTQTDEGDWIDLYDYSPTRSGYTLSGWAKSSNATSYEYGVYDEFAPTSDQTLYAVWKKMNVVTLDANGGSFGTKTTETWTQEYSSDWLYLRDYKPTRDGYVLQGWAKDKDAASTDYSTNDYITPDGDLTLYAVWSESITVILDANGGTFGTSSTLTWTKGVTSNYLYLSDYNPMRNNYIIKGWSTKESGEVEYSNSYSPTENTTLYAIWGEAVTITFNANGGVFPKTVENAKNYSLSSDQKVLKKIVEKGSYAYVSSSYLPTKSKVALLGWGTSAKATEPEEGSDLDLWERVTSNKTYYAVWATACTVTFKTTGSLKFYSGGSYVTSTKVLVPKGCPLSGDYTPSTYVVTTSGESTSYNWIKPKWGTSQSTKAGNAFFADGYKVSANVTLYAINATTVTIKWNGNGGKVWSSSEKCVLGDRTTGGATPIRNGYFFVGWSTTKKSSGLVDFANGIYALKNTTYYAIWKKGYKITIKGNGGTIRLTGKGGFFNSIICDGSTLTAYIQKGSSLNELRHCFNVEKDNVTLKGLATSTNGKPIANLDDYYPSGNLTLYAVAGTMYPITYNANGGTFYASGLQRTSYTISYAKGDHITQYTGSKNGYSFEGWYSKAKGGSEVKKATKKMTIYAHWKKNKKGSIKITWNANGGRLSSSSYKTKRTTYHTKGNTLEEYQYDVAYSSANNKGFKGWSTSKNGAVLDLGTYKVTKNITLYAIWSSGDDLADGRVVLSKSRYVFTGNAIKPSVTVYDRSGKKVAASQYTISYEDNIDPGYGTVIVKAKGKKSGVIKKDFNINYDAKSSVKSAKVSKKNVAITYTKATGAEKYDVYAINKNTGAIKSVTSKTTSATIKSLAKGTYQIYVLPSVAYSDGDGYYTSELVGTIKTVTIK